MYRIRGLVMRYEKVDEKDSMIVERECPYKVRNIVLVFALATMLLTTSILTAGFLSAKGYDGHERVALSTTFSTGSGTADDPYMIYNVHDLQNMSNDLSAHYALANDIYAGVTRDWNWNDTVNIYEGFEPVGSGPYDEPINHFIGNFNGNNYTITGLYINRLGGAYVGLFGFIGSEGSVSNLGLVDIEVNAWIKQYEFIPSNNIENMILTPPY